ncbi:uncharacterized protein LOC134459635 [Engraulis encrasicolus]|uniref:uncharacterized protein LOC134459635 n=1 Tax=Engraulis encrasicolus TaxID=184585 RepID=UPI002FD2A683
MGYDRAILLEGLSELIGAQVKSSAGGGGASGNTFLRSEVSGAPSSSNTLSVEDLLSAVYFPEQFWQDKTSSGIGLRSAPQGVCNDLFLTDCNFFDPRFDYDFTNIKDTTTFMRGSEVYKRPCGWQRYALKVLNKYPDGNAWLGSAGYRTWSDPNEWPVSYHGTGEDGARGIISTHYLAGSGARYGRGIYSTPDPTVAENDGYAKTFVSKRDGQKYKICLQNRINPRRRQVHNGGKYWLIPVPPGTDAWQERDIVMGNIRPYSLLLKRC